MKIKVLTILMFTMIFSGVLFLVGGVLAQDSNYGLDTIAGRAQLKKNTDVSVLSGQVLGIALSMIGVIFFGLMVYGGVLWMTARGNAQQTDKALNTIISAIIGLIIVLAAYVLVNFIFQTASGGGNGSEQCANPIVGLGAGCSDIAPIVACADTNIMDCNSNGLCQSISDSLCPTQCGADFSCRPTADCDSSTVVNFYCTGGNDNICCKAKTN